MSRAPAPYGGVDIHAVLHVCATRRRNQVAESWVPPLRRGRRIGGSWALRGTLQILQFVRRLAEARTSLLVACASAHMVLR